VISSLFWFRIFSLWREPLAPPLFSLAPVSTRLRSFFSDSNILRGARLGPGGAFGGDLVVARVFTVLFETFLP